MHALSLSQGGAEDRVDFVLVEYIMALTLHRRGIVKAIMPVILNEQDDGTHTDRCVASQRRENQPKTTLPLHCTALLISSGSA